MKPRVVLVGDVHGCLLEAQELITEITPRVGLDRVIFLGDLVDRGPFPVETVRWIRSSGYECLLGNHESKLVRWRRREAQRRETGRENKMRAPSPERQAQWEAFTEEEVDWLRRLPVMLDLADNWMAVHGGLTPGVPLENQNPDKVIRLRALYPDTMKAASLTDEQSLDDPPGSVFWTTLWKGPWSIVYGHAVHGLEHPRIDRMQTANGTPIACIGIDTGVCFGGRLTAAILGKDGDAEFVQVQSKRQYAVLGETR